jgi:hypothetical protein
MSRKYVEEFLYYHGLSYIKSVAWKSTRSLFTWRERESLSYVIMYELEKSSYYHSLVFFIAPFYYAHSTSHELVCQNANP